MSFFSFLYSLLIGPLELFFETVFHLANRTVENPGLSIIVLSLFMNFLVLPLYKQADSMQEKQRQDEKRMEPWVRHIKKTFKGDERYMILNTYYRQNHYKPTYALRGSVSLLLEIPFFMAAYNMLSGLSVLQGTAFGPIRNLGAPDGLLQLGSLAINVLPIAMTLINFVTSAMYTRGFPLKSKLQLYGMALIFLVLLYDSPSGLVFYWTLNNVFSFFKTLFYKLKNPRKAAAVGASIAGLLLLIFITFLHPMATARSQILFTAMLLLLQLPIILLVLEKKFPRKKEVTLTKTDRALFWGGALMCTLLLGLLIPSGVIASAPQEFVNKVTRIHPNLYVLKALMLAAGTFLVWNSIFYTLASPGFKKCMGPGMVALGCIFFIDYLFFSTDLGLLNASLQYELPPQFPFREQLLNLGLILLAAGGIYLLYRWKDQVLKVICTAACITLVILSSVNLLTTGRQLKGHMETLPSPAGMDLHIPLSRQGRNVMVIMMDRAIGSYVPYILNEKPELQRQLSGFTYYPNTISYGPCTNIGSPALYGGYEYQPLELNRRDQELLEDKHNEALKVMPVTFLRNGFHVTVCDPSYAGYDWVPDLSIYDDYPEIRTHITQIPTEGDLADEILRSEKVFERNLFYYSLFKAAPVVIQPTLYVDGTYNDPNAGYAGLIQVRDGLYRSQGYREAFLNAFSALMSYPRMVEIQDGTMNTFLMISNDTTHEPCMLQEPEYLPAEAVDNRDYEKDHGSRFNLGDRTLHMDTEEQVMHYQINVAGLLQLGNFMDFLRQEGVYENTRIIVVADHGHSMNQLDQMVYDENLDTMGFNPLLMMKDFGSKELTMDKRFMTNADTPNLAFSGLISDPHNPFTGKKIDESPKQGPQSILIDSEWDVNINNGTTFLPGPWYSVEDNIFELENWHRIPDPTAKP